MSDENQSAREKIAEIRETIDEIDCQLVRLLNKRAKNTLAIRKLKPQAQWGLYDPKREEEIFAHVAQCNEGPLFADDLRDIFDTVLRVSKEMRV